MVVGDVMIDGYIWGKVDRLSPEAPVPVVHVQDREKRLGGAANVALNLKTLGAEPLICTAVGEDASGNDLMDLMEKRGFNAEGILRHPSRVTTLKTRVISQGQHLLRVDEEDTAPLTSEVEKAFVDRTIGLMDREKPAVIIFEDYNKGLLTETVISSIIAAALDRGIPTTVDPKDENFFAYRQVSLFKPNLKELREGLGLKLDGGDREALRKAITELEARLGNTISLITLSEHGILVHQDDVWKSIPAHRREIVDVSGAGDTVIAVASLCLAVGASCTSLAALSNLAGGLVCEKVGVVPIEQLQLLDAVSEI